MMILHEDENGVTNMDNVIRLERNGRYLTAYTVDGSNHQIGRYDTQEKAKDAFNKIYLMLEKEYG